jgi:hypothetical protein
MYNFEGLYLNSFIQVPNLCKFFHNYRPNSFVSKAYFSHHDGHLLQRPKAMRCKEPASVITLGDSGSKIANINAKTSGCGKMRMIMVITILLIPCLCTLIFWDGLPISSSLTCLYESV